MPPSKLAVELEDAGGVIGPASWPLGDGEDLAIEVVGEIQPKFFPDCPICGAQATTLEHIPPQSLGGKKMTRTCEPCNSRLGGYVEPDLMNWFHVALPSARFRSASFPGTRSAGQVLLRSTPTGQLIGEPNPGAPPVAEAIAYEATGRVHKVCSWWGPSSSPGTSTSTEQSLQPSIVG
jgi:hypothetical protein